jgi:hypothetical protein
VVADYAHLPDDELLSLSAKQPQPFGEFYENIDFEIDHGAVPRLELVYADGTTRVATFP